ncbi:hypothetical protein WN943_007027 [Citrus x changshan-huyou]
MAAAVAAERKHEVLSDDEGISVSVEDQKLNEDMPEAHDAAMKIERAEGAYMAYSGLREKPSKLEIWTLHCYNGLILASPFLGLISKQLDHGYNPQLIARAATAIGSLFCLPVGFIKTPCIFPFYIAAIVALYIVASASHTRHLGLMARGYTGPTLKLSQSPTRRGVSGWFSGPQMARWHAPYCHTEPGAITNATSSMPESYSLSLFKNPHAITSLIVIFMSSFSSMCIFTGAIFLLFLYLWIIYFILPSSSTTLLHPLQHVIKADAVRMQFLGVLLALLTSGTGFYYKEKNWQRHHVLLFAAIQSTSAGLLHAFGRVLLLDCTPHGKEGAFPVWHSWVKALGTCTGFAVASAISGNVSTAFGVSFLAATIGILILIFGDISDVGGEMAAGHLHEASEKGSPVPGLDTSIIIKEHAHEEIA